MARITINVSSAAQLASALAKATGGETILLAPGNYGAVSIKGRAMSETVTIKSANAQNDAVITDLRIDRSSGFRFEDLDLSRPLAKGESTATQAAFISSSSKIQIVGMDFRGSMDGNSGNDGTGLRITSSTDVSVTGSTFEQWKNAAVVSDVAGLQLSGNSVTGAQRSFDLSGLANATISGNRFDGVRADFNPAAFAGKNVTFADNVVVNVGTSATGGGATTTTVAPPDLFAGGKTATVANAAQLNAAIAAAKGGETILLAPGDYGAISIKGRMLDTTVTIKSADAARDAVFSDIRISNSSGFTFSDVDVHRPLKAGEGDFVPAVYVSGSKQIGFVGVDFTGSMDNNPWNDGVGLRISYSQNVRLIDSTFEQWTNAVTFDHDKGLLIAGNSVTAVREGFDFAAVHDVVIARNLFTGFKPNFAAGDHSDMIQVWTAGVNEGSSNLLIRDNVMMSGTNGGVQGILISSQNAYRHSNVVIENNLYNGDARHGISLHSTDGGAIRGNTVTTAPGGKLEAGINLWNDTGIVVERNTAPLLLDGGSNSGIAWAGNIDLWDTVQRKGVALDSVFAGGGKGSSIAAYALKAGGAAALAGAGFGNVDGIGAAAFELSNHGNYGHLAALLAPVAHFA